MRNVVYLLQIQPFESNCLYRPRPPTLRALFPPLLGITPYLKRLSFPPTSGNWLP